MSRRLERDVVASAVIGPTKDNSFQVSFQHWIGSVMAVLDHGRKVVTGCCGHALDLSSRRTLTRLPPVLHSHTLKGTPASSTVTLKFAFFFAKVTVSNGLHFRCWISNDGAQKCGSSTEDTQEREPVWWLESKQKIQKDSIT